MDPVPPPSLPYFTEDNVLGLITAIIHYQKTFQFQAVLDALENMKTEVEKSLAQRQVQL